MTREPESRVISARALNLSLHQRELGQLVVRVHDGSSGRRPIDQMLVALYHGDTESQGALPARFGYTSPAGDVALDTLAPGGYGVVVRQIGWKPAPVPATVRRGFADTVEVTTWPQVICES